jgi:hypothetical protein
MHMHLPDEETRPLVSRPNRSNATEEFCAVHSLQPYQNNARTHSKKQLRQIADSIQRFGFTNPVLVTGDNMIIAGHGRVEAAKLLGMTEVPMRRLANLDKDEVRAYILADNRIAENAGWDKELLALEFEALIYLDFDIEILGISATEIDLTIDGFGRWARDKSSDAAGPDPVLDQIEPVASGPAITQPGDLWLLEPHRLLCGDARSGDDVARVCGGASGSSANGNALNDGSASNRDLVAGLSLISCMARHNGSEGVPLCHDAKSRRFR